ncbi:nucleotide excision repair TFIIH subunit, partial [Dimargaris cristalligena]
GVLIECDTTAKQVLKKLNNDYHFIIADLDDTHLFVNGDYVAMLKAELDRVINENTFKIEGI